MHHPVYTADTFQAIAKLNDHAGSYHAISIKSSEKVMSQNSCRMSQSQLQAILIIIFIASVDLQQFVVAQTQQMITPKVVAGSGIGQCPLQGERRAAIDDISNGIMDILQLREHQCGDGMWYRIAYLNVSDSSQQCPSVWRDYGTI